MYGFIVLADPAGNTFIWLLIEPDSGVPIVQNLPRERDTSNGSDGFTEAPMNLWPVAGDENDAAERLY